MLALVPVIGQIINALVQGKQLSNQQQAQMSQSFATFMQNTNGTIYTIMRNAIVGIFAASLVMPHWGQTLAQNASAMPPYFWAIIGWEFYGNQALALIPWVKGVPAPAPAQSPQDGDVLSTSADGGKWVRDAAQPTGMRYIPANGHA
jgi:hypothetical protein